MPLPVNVTPPRPQNPGEWVEKLARLGYATKGVVYAVIGVLALQAAIGAGGSTEGTRGAIQEIGDKPFGQLLLVLTAAGLLGYSVWRIFEAIFDPTREGRRPEGIAKRIGYLVSGLTYLGLAYWTASIVLGWGSGGTGDGEVEQEWTARLLSQPFGPWLVGLLGAIVIGVGLYHINKAYKSEFTEGFNPSRTPVQGRRWVERIGRFGLAARGVTFCIIGAFLIQAAIRFDPNQARGLGGALRSLLEQPYGPWLLGIVAAGLIAYGAYCLSLARYSHFPTR